MATASGLSEVSNSNTIATYTSKDTPFLSVMPYYPIPDRNNYIWIGSTASGVAKFKHK